MTTDDSTLIDTAGFDSFVQWFNKNLAGKTIYTADEAVIRRRIVQWGHLDGLTADELVALTADVWLSKRTAA